MYKVSAIAELPGHEDRAWAVAWNSSRPILASCSADKSVRLYTYSLGQEGTPKFIPVSTIPTGHTKTVRSIAWSPSGKTLATGSFDSNIGIWEQENVGEDELGAGEWECMTILEGHETECKGVAYSSSGTLLASCSRDKTVWIWEVHPDADFECLGVLMEHTQDVKCVAWHPSEEILASGSYDDTIKLYIDDPTEDWYCFATLSGHSSTVWSLAWSPQGSYLASASDDKTVRVWKRTEEFKWETVLAINAHDRTVYSVSWGVGKPQSAERSLGWLATASGDGSIKVWELKDGSTEAAAPEHRLIATLPSAHGVYDVNTVSWCPRAGMEDILATTGDDGVTRVWKIVPE
ncbi:putative cytosolic iron-sulfur protein assembly protein 1 [Leucoagaricus sp. SymC.cos]|nr:putative cytosolic iron-sulfur protein assembly protein 1 [Leucoagaricus sp. SymC.cos]